MEHDNICECMHDSEEHSDAARYRYLRAHLQWRERLVLNCSDAYMLDATLDAAIAKTTPGAPQ